MYKFMSSVNKERLKFYFWSNWFFLVLLQWQEHQIHCRIEVVSTEILAVFSITGGTYKASTVQCDGNCKLFPISDWGSFLLFLFCLIFCHEYVLNFVNNFATLINMITCLFSSATMMTYNDWFLNVNLILHYWNKHQVVMIYYCLYIFLGIDGLILG